MLNVKPILFAAAMLILSGCSTVPSVSLTVKKTPPQSCLTQCEPLEKPLSGSDLDIRMWEYRAVDQYGLCRRLHSDCVAAISK